MDSTLFVTLAVMLFSDDGCVSFFLFVLVIAPCVVQLHMGAQLVLQGSRGELGNFLV